jgi:hypothetical protein
MEAKLQNDLDRLTARLSAEFQVPTSQVREVVNAAATRFGDARVTTFVPILVERDVRLVMRRPRGDLSIP